MKNCPNHTAATTTAMPRSGCLTSIATIARHSAIEISIAGEAGPLLLLGEQPGGEHGKARLDEFRGLERQTRQIDPAPRALDLGPDHEGRREQRERDREHRERDRV